MRVSGELNQLVARFEHLLAEQRRLTEAQDRIILEQNGILTQQLEIIARIELIRGNQPSRSTISSTVNDNLRRASRNSEGRPRNLVFDLEYQEPEQIAAETNQGAEDFRAEVVNDRLSTPTNQQSSSSSDPSSNSSDSTNDDLPSSEHFRTIRSPRNLNVGDTVLIVNRVTHGSGPGGRVRNTDLIGTVKKINPITTFVTLKTRSGKTVKRIVKNLKVRTNVVA